MMKRELDELLADIGPDEEIHFSVDVASTDPEEGRRVFAPTLVGSTWATGGNLLVVMLDGDWNIPEEDETGKTAHEQLLIGELSELIDKIDGAGWHKSETASARAAILKVRGG